jgi:ABC-type uncharacterized transport system permease subunit
VSVFQLFARAIPLLLFSIFFFGITPDVNMYKILQFLPAYLISFLLFLSFGFLISSLAFYFTEVFSFYILNSALITLLSGAVIPITMFPESFIGIISWTPYPYLYYYPTAILLDMPMSFSYNELLIRYFIQLFCVSSLAFMIYNSGIKKMEFAGG